MSGDRRGLAVLGLFLALVGYHQSLAPTLLVRDWYLQGAVTGVSVALGYGVGALVQRLGGAVLRRFGVRVPTMPVARTTFGLVLGIGFVLATLHANDLQRWTYDRLGLDETESWWARLGTVAVAAAVVLVVVGLVKVIAVARGRLTWLADKVLPRWIAAGVATVLVLWFVAFSLNNWVYQRTLDGLNETFTLSDGVVDEGQVPPTSSLRSTGPASQVVWEETGREGRRFLTSGPSVTELAALTPSGEAVEPVRVFVGREQEQDPRARAALALDELERFGAFDREAVAVVIPTGTGWINEQIVQPLEYFHAGDVATVSMQYSHLPSPLAFLTEAQAAQESGEALITAVAERIESMPAGERPQFYVAGESLGTFGASAAFDDLADLVASTDASLWNGPPASVHLRRQAEDERVPGSLQIRPVWEGGDEVLFANRASDLTEFAEQQPDVDAVFLQHADDAIVWWDWPVLNREPDWLEEPLDAAVNPDMQWYPVTTFLNLAVDMAVATTFDEGQGHMYGTQPALAWHLMLDPVGWDDARLEALLEQLETIPRSI